MKYLAHAKSCKENYSRDDLEMHRDRSKMNKVRNDTLRYETRKGQMRKYIGYYWDNI